MPLKILENSRSRFKRDLLFVPSLEQLLHAYLTFMVKRLFVERCLTDRILAGFLPRPC
jgi:hypothetical protein